MRSKTRERPAPRDTDEKGTVGYVSLTLNPPITDLT